MSDILDFDELKQAIDSTASAAGSFTSGLAKTVGNYACDLYHAYPGYVTQQEFTGGPLNAFYQGMFDSLCGSPPASAAAPVPLYSGGQCPFLYDVAVSVTQNYSNDGPYSGQASQTFNVSTQAVGPISVAIETDPPASSNAILYHSIIVRFGHTGQPNPSRPNDPYSISLGGLRSDYGNFTINSITLVPVGGQPDTCGNPPPPPIPKPISSETNKASSFTVNVSNKDGSVTNKTYSVNFGGIVVNKNDNSKTTFPLTINNSPVTIDLGSDGFGTSSGSGGADPETTKQLSDLADLIKALTALLAECCKGVQPTVPTVVPADQPKTQTGKKKLAFVQVVIDELSVDAKVTYGNDSPNVVFAGWFEFSQGQFFYPRQYISFGNNIFSAPPGADGYAYHLYNGFKGHTIELTVDSATS